MGGRASTSMDWRVTKGRWGEVTGLGLRTWRMEEEKLDGRSRGEYKPDERTLK